MRINQNGETMRNPIFRWIHIEHELTGDSAKIKWLDEAQKRLFFDVFCSISGDSNSRWHLYVAALW